MKISENVPIAAIAVRMPAARRLFESLGIDYACGGQRSLADAAYAAGLDTQVVVAGLRRMRSDEGESWDDRPLRDLIQHLVSEHHHFVRDEMMSLALWLADLCAPPAKPGADLQLLRTAFSRLADAIIPHIHEEERVFMQIEALENEWQSSEPPHGDADLRGHLQRLITEHGTIAAQLRTIRDLRLRLMTANDLVPTVRRALDAIGELEAHLHEYMFLENCILFPRAIALEEQLVTA